MVRPALLTLGLCFLAADVDAQVGSVIRSQLIGESMGGFGGSLGANDNFASSLAALGDLNGDGVGDLAVGASWTKDGGRLRGAVWILFLNRDGTVASETKISQTQGGFTGTLADGGYFGARVANVGDLDGDGVPELAVTSGRPSRIWILFLKPDGRLKSQTENPLSGPLFVPPVVPSHFNGDRGFGGLQALGDLDGDGLGDLAVGAPYDPDGSGVWTGSLWILRLDSDGTIKGAHKISETQGGFTGALEREDLFGREIILLGDLDGDGNPELGVGAREGGPTRSFWVLNLDANERVRSQRAFGVSDYGFVPATGPAVEGFIFSALGDLDGDGIGEVAMTPGAICFLRPDGSVKKRLRGLPFFGYAFAPLGDLDGDGSLELAHGFAQTVSILSLDPDAERRSSVNTQILTQASEPVIGATWTATLNCGGHAPGLAAVWGYSAPLSGHFTPYGEVLVTGKQIFDLLQPHSGGPSLFQVNVPLRVDLIDLTIFIQGACTGRPGVGLSNALDVLVGF
jgi:hypothetical protein